MPRRDWVTVRKDIGYLVAVEQAFLRQIAKWAIAISCSVRVTGRIFLHESGWAFCRSLR